MSNPFGLGPAELRGFRLACLQVFLTGRKLQATAPCLLPPDGRGATFRIDVAHTGDQVALVAALTWADASGRPADDLQGDAGG